MKKKPYRVQPKTEAITTAGVDQPRIWQRGEERTIARDRYGTRMWIARNQKGTYDFITDGYMRLTPGLAHKLAQQLLRFAADKECGL